MSLETLVAEMRRLGIQSLALAPAGSPSAVVPPTLDEPLTESAESAPGAPDDVEPEFRPDPNQCATVGCGEPNGGALNQLRHLCRKCAFAQMGVK